MIAIRFSWLVVKLVWLILLWVVIKPLAIKLAVFLVTTIETAVRVGTETYRTEMAKLTADG